MHFPVHGHCGLVEVWAEVAVGGGGHCEAGLEDGEGRRYTSSDVDERGGRGRARKRHSRRSAPQSGAAGRRTRNTAPAPALAGSSSSLRERIGSSQIQATSMGGVAGTHSVTMPGSVKATQVRDPSANAATPTESTMTTRPRYGRIWYQKSAVGTSRHMYVKHSMGLRQRRTREASPVRLSAQEQARRTSGAPQ